MGKVSQCIKKTYIIRQELKQSCLNGSSWKNNMTLLSIPLLKLTEHLLNDKWNTLVSALEPNKAVMWLPCVFSTQAESQHDPSAPSATARMNKPSASSQHKHKTPRNFPHFQCCFINTSYSTSCRASVIFSCPSSRVAKYLQTRAHPCWRQMCPRLRTETDSCKRFLWTIFR